MKRHIELMPSLGSYFGIEESIVQHAFSFEINNAAEAEVVSNHRDMPFAFSSRPNGKIHLRALGARSRNLAIWKTETRSGFYSKPKDAIDVMGLRLIFNGQLSRKVGAKEFACATDLGMFIPFPSVQDLVAYEGTQMITGAFDRRALTETWRTLDHSDAVHLADFVPLVPLNTTPMRCFVRLIHVLLEWLQSNPPKEDKLYPLIEEALMLQLLIAWPTESYSHPPVYSVSSRVMKIALDFIEAHLSEPISAADVARASGYGLRSLQKAFRQNIGCSPSVYIINRRLDQVHTELKKDDADHYVSQIAFKWGFTHMGDFSRRYKQRFGVTPTQSRKI